jgi:hypothetical protein
VVRCPRKIDAGEVKAFYFPHSKDRFLKEGSARVGINDTDHRIIWCAAEAICRKLINRIGGSSSMVRGLS